MKLTQRVSNAVKAFGGTLGNSVPLGTVLRNWGNESHYSPNRQLRGITYKAIDKIGTSQSKYKPFVERPNGDVYENHPLYNLVRQPNPNQTGKFFFHLEAMIYEIYGETFWYLVRGDQSNKIKEIYLLNPAQMELVVQNGELTGYILHKANGEQVPFTLEEIYHDKRPNPFNEWRGMSVMERASQYIDIELVTTSFTLNYMRNNASPSGIVSLPSMEQEAFKQFAAQWREGYEGPENAGKTAFIRGGEADFKAVGATLKDVDQKITRDMAKEDVLMMFDMPKGLLGAAGEKGLGRAETEALEYIFAKHKVDPNMERLDGIWEYILAQMPSNSEQRSVTVTHESPIPADKVFELQQADKGVGRWMTQNEARRYQGLEPLPGGDILPPPKEMPASPAEPSKSKQVITKKIVLKKKPTKAELAKKLNDEQEAFRSNLVKTNDIYAVKVKKEISQFADKQKTEIIGRINATSKSFEEWLFNIKEESEKMAAAVTPVIIDLMEAQSEDVANFITGELLTISPEVRKAVEADILKVSGVFNTDTLAALEKTLVEGQTEGESLVKLKKRVETVYSEAQGYRAERIARTESLRASNNTAELVYKQNGFTKVEWFTNPGACEFCSTYSGRTKEVGTVFTPIGEVVDGVDGGQMRVEYSDIGVPPLHPNCTCSLVPVE